MLQAMGNEMGSRLANETDGGLGVGPLYIRQWWSPLGLAGGFFSTHTPPLCCSPPKSLLLQATSMLSGSIIPLVLPDRSFVSLLLAYGWQRKLRKPGSHTFKARHSDKLSGAKELLAIPVVDITNVVSVYGDSPTNYIWYYNKVLLSALVSLSQNES